MNDTPHNDDNNDNTGCIDCVESTKMASQPSNRGVTLFIFTFGSSKDSNRF